MESRLLYTEFLVLGAGILIAWNAILTALDWFNTVFPDRQVSFIFTILNFLPYVIFQPLTIWKGSRFSLNMRIIPTFAVICALLALSPLLSATLQVDAAFALMCVLIVVMGIANAIAQTSVFSLGAMMPPKYTNAVMLGNAVAGIIITLARIICLASFPHTDSGLLVSTLIYFAIAGVFILGCIFTQIHVMRNPLVQEYVSKATNKDINLTPGQGEELQIMDSTEQSFMDVSLPTIKNTYKKIWQYSFLVWMVFVITFGVFPAVSLANEDDNLSYPWFATLMITIFNFFDALGRYGVSMWLPKSLVLWVMTFSRFIFWLTFILIASDSPSIPPDWLFNGTWFKFINMALFAFTNGFVSTCLMIHGASSVVNSMKERAGAIMSTSLVFGIFSGSLIALNFTGVGHIPQ
jgi:MFS family permease